MIHKSSVRPVKKEMYVRLIALPLYGWTELSVDSEEVFHDGRWPAMLALEKAGDRSPSDEARFSGESGRRGSVCSLVSLE